METCRDWKRVSTTTSFSDSPDLLLLREVRVHAVQLAALVDVEGDLVSADRDQDLWRFGFAIEP